MSRHSCPPRPVFQSDVVTLRDGAARSNAAPKPLTIICTACGGEGREIRSRYGGNDPDTWDAGVCERCDETGYEVVSCEACWEPAVRMFQGNALCMAHYEEWRADAEVSREEYPDNGPTDPWRTSGPGFGT